MKNLSIIELADLTASKEPVPGGGSISALCGTLAGALAEMVAGLTIGKKKYMKVSEEMEVIKKEASELRNSLLEDIQRDSEAFDLVMQAFSMAKSTDEEKAARSQAIQNGLKEASKVPFEVAKKALEVEKLAVKVIEKGNQNAITDGKVALMMARTAVLGAGLNVKINLDSIKDEAFVKDYASALDKIEKEAVETELNIMF